MDRKRSQGHSRSKVTILVLDPVFMYQHQQFLQSSLSDSEIKKITRKSKTEAVLQRRSMLKLGVICKYMKRYGKC